MFDAGCSEMKLQAEGSSGLAVMPQTRWGSRTVAAAAVFLIFLALDQLAVAFGHPNYAPGIVISYGVAGIVAVLYGIGAVISSKERSILVFVSLGLVVSAVVVVQIMPRLS